MAKNITSNNFFGCGCHIYSGNLFILATEENFEKKRDKNIEKSAED